MDRKVNRKTVTTVVTEMEKSIDNEAVLIKTAANNVGYNHLTRIETESILTHFVRLHPEFGKYQLNDPEKAESTQSLFTTAYVALNGQAGAVLLNAGK
ncbi:hypothetical protein [Loigolactobacillus backii]|uniref:hypothetical protein n=1 Tax=Loigolactobacillus backii TaxID=375175 RepID=UPI0007F0C56E|nr:hypothetical protein [Loigolactobacillus backii]ANK59796.1 hypothetical protein AYR52_05700 [Loigolactobacillus backii]